MDPILALAAIPFGGVRWGPWDPLGRDRRGGRRPTFWRPKADIMEAEGRLNGGLGAKPPGNWGPWAPWALFGPISYTRHEAPRGLGDPVNLSLDFEPLTATSPLPT